MAGIKKWLASGLLGIGFGGLMQAQPIVDSFAAADIFLSKAAVGFIAVAACFLMVVSALIWMSVFYDWLRQRYIVRMETIILGGICIVGLLAAMIWALLTASKITNTLEIEPVPPTGQNSYPTELILKVTNSTPETEEHVRLRLERIKIVKDGRLNGSYIEPYDLLPVMSGGDETQPIKSGGSRTYLLGKLLSIPLTPKEREKNPYKGGRVQLHLGKNEFGLVKEGETAFFSVVARSEGFIDGFEKVYKVKLDENGVLTGPEEVRKHGG